MYESEFTRFIREYKERHPQVVELQKKNRATWWDKPQDLETTRERAEATVSQPSYVYFPLPEREGEEEAAPGPRVDNPTRSA